MDELRGRFILLDEDSARAAIANDWLKDARRSSTAQTYRYEIRRWFEWCDANEIDALTPTRADVNGYRQHLLRRHEESTTAKKLSALSSFYRYGRAEHADQVPDNPLERVTRPKLSRESATAGLDAGEVRRLLRAAERFPSRDRAVVLVLYATGVRVSELCGAMTNELRVERGHLQMRVRRKGGKRTYVTIRPEAVAALREYLGDRTDRPLFIGARGGAITRFEVAGILDRLVGAAGIRGKRITPHSMRHTYATLSLDGGADIRDLQESMGHASIETTMRYNRARSTVERSPTHLLAWAADEDEGQR